jgi:hypothetical protein
MTGQCQVSAYSAPFDDRLGAPLASLPGASFSREAVAVGSWFPPEVDTGTDTDRAEPQAVEDKDRGKDRAARLVAADKDRDTVALQAESDRAAHFAQAGAEECFAPTNQSPVEP